MSDGQLAVVGVGSVGSMALWQASKLGIAAVGFEAHVPGASAQRRGRRQPPVPDDVPRGAQPLPCAPAGRAPLAGARGGVRAGDPDPVRWPVDRRGGRALRAGAAGLDPAHRRALRGPRPRRDGAPLSPAPAVGGGVRHPRHAGRLPPDRSCRVVRRGRGPGERGDGRQERADPRGHGGGRRGADRDRHRQLDVRPGDRGVGQRFGGGATALPAEAGAPEADLPDLVRRPRRQAVRPRGVPDLHPDHRRPLHVRRADGRRCDRQGHAGRARRAGGGSRRARQRAHARRGGGVRGDGPGVPPGPGARDRPVGRLPRPLHLRQDRSPGAGAAAATASTARPGSRERASRCARRSEPSPPPRHRAVGSSSTGSTSCVPRASPAAWIRGSARGRSGSR